MEPTITLTPEIIAIMKQAGIDEVEIKQMANVVTVKKVSSKKKSHQIPAQEYILVSTRHCKLCGTETVTRFHMVQNEDNPSILESHPFTEETPPDLNVQRRYRVWNTCSHCRDYLSKLDKDTLADMVMTLHTKREIWK